MNQNMAYPHVQPPQPVKQGSGLKPIHLVITAVIAFVLGILAMIAFALIVPSDKEDNSVGAGNTAAVRYLDSKGIQIEPETYSKVARVLCDGFSDGSKGSDLKPVVSQTIGTSMVDSSEIVAASAVYSCPEHIGKLAR